MEQDKNHINSILRAVELLNLYGKDTKELGITELARQMNLHKSSVHRIVRTLEFAGWLEKNRETGKYKLGVQILDVASTVLHSYDYRDIIGGYMRELRDEVKETIVLSVYTSGRGICIDLAEADNKIAYTSKLGHSTPVYSGATGKILLAYQSADEIERVIDAERARYTPNTIVSGEELRAHLREIREKGYALSFEETDPGVSAVGAPIFDKRGNFLYGISIVGPTERLNEKGLSHLVSMITEKSREISEKISSITL